jgi:Glycosyltransferase
VIDSLYVVIPGDLEIRTGGYGYDRRIIAGLRDRGWRIDVLGLDDSFPGADAGRASARDPGARRHPGRVDGARGRPGPRRTSRRDRTRIGSAEGRALVHHPLAEETGIDPTLAASLKISESRALAAVRAIVVTSRTTAARLDDYGVAASRITVVEPGTDPAPLARGSAAAGPPPGVALLCVATLTPRKGYELLMSALAAIPPHDWRLTCAGSLDRDAPTVARVLEQVRDNGFENRISFVGDLDAAAVAVQYDCADVFVLPTLYEGYGMVVAEALARGLPVVSTATGAILDLVGSDAGIVVPPAICPRSPMRCRA